MEQKKILITGFEPFGGDTVNPSYETVKELPDRIGKWEVVKEILPVSFTESIRTLKKLIALYHPDVVLCVGQAGGRHCVSLEKIAVNLADATIPDNDGVIPENETLIEKGPDGVFSNLPVRDMVKNVTDHEIPCYVSYSAGTYVCNCVFYHTMALCKNEYPGMRGGFIHLPYLHRQIAESRMKKPGMSLETMVKSVELLIEAIPYENGQTL